MNPVLRCALLLVLVIPTVRAVDFGALQPQGYLSDFASVIGPAERAALEQYCASVEQSTGAQISLVTLPALEGEPIEDVANLMFRKWGVGTKGKNEGILLLLAVGDHRSRLEVGYGLEPIIPDGFSGSLLRQMRPALREQQYGEAMLVAANVIGSRIAQAKGVQIRPIARVRRSRPVSVPWPIVAGGILMLFWMMRLGARSRGYGYSGGGFLPALLIGQALGRSSGGFRSGGGFDGYDSHDSFGGFGGGDSGGGGASSDW